MADTPTGETVTPVAPSNETGTPVAPPVVNNSADVETAKRDADQARLRANQLENENRKLKEAQDETQRKQLEEKEEFKKLYEQTQSQLKEIQDAQAVSERQKELSTATETVFKDYPENVVSLAKTTGLGLSDDSEAAQTILKEKLDAIQKQVGTSAKPVPNNPHNPGPQVTERSELVSRQNLFEGSQMALASAKGDQSVIKSYIKDLPAIKRMKEIAQNGI